MMNIANDDNKNLISNSLGFYLYELLGVDYSGIYVSSFEMKQISDKFNFDVKLTDNHKMFGEILSAAKRADKIVEILESFKVLAESRIAQYDALSEKFPRAADATDEWRIKAKRALRKIGTAIKKAQNESIS